MLVYDFLWGVTEYSAPCLKTIVADGQGRDKTIEDGLVRIKRKTEVVVQTHQLTTVHLTRLSVQAWCEPCRAEVVMLTPEEAAALTQGTAREIYRRVENGELHSIETDAGALRVCANSLGGTISASEPERNRR